MQHTSKNYMAIQAPKQYNSVEDRMLPKSSKRLLICKIELITEDRNRFVQIIAEDASSRDVWFFDAEGFDCLPADIAILNPDIKGDDNYFNEVASSRDDIQTLIHQLANIHLEDTEGWTTKDFIHAAEGMGYIPENDTHEVQHHMTN